MADRVHADTNAQGNAALGNRSPSSMPSVAWLSRMGEFRDWLADGTCQTLCFLEDVDEYRLSVTHRLGSLIQEGLFLASFDMAFVDLCTIGDVSHLDFSHYITAGLDPLIYLAMRSLLYQIIYLDPRSLDRLQSFLTLGEVPLREGLGQLFHTDERMRFSPKIPDPMAFMLDALISTIGVPYGKVFLIINNIHIGWTQFREHILEDLQDRFNSKRKVRVFICGGSSSPHPVQVPPGMLLVDFEKEAERKEKFHIRGLRTLNSASDCIQSLHFQEWKDRRSLVSLPYENTGEWLWEHLSFVRWSQSKPVLWIQGKPGSGKSTIARMITKRLGEQGTTTFCLSKSKDADERGNALIADFFYSARMGEKGTRHVYMLRSILYQLLSQNTSLYEHFKPTFRELLERHQELAEVRWQVSDLMKVLENIAEDDSVGRAPLMCVLDGFDESEGFSDTASSAEHLVMGRIELLNWLTNLSRNHSHFSWFKILVVSRPSTDIQRILRREETIIVDHHNGSAIAVLVNAGIQQIKTTVSDWARIDSESMDDGEATSRVWEDVPEGIDSSLPPVRERLLKRADGCILWVILVLQELLRLYQSHRLTIAELEETIDSLPQGLEELYIELVQRLQRRIGVSGLQQARKMLIWACFSQRPLTLDEFRDALAMTDRPFDLSDSLPSNYLHRHRIVLPQKHNWAPMERFITDTCGCLLEVVQPISAKRSVGLGHVQLTHQTVKEFLVRRDDRLNALDINPGTARCAMFNTLANYLLSSIPGPSWASKDVENWQISDYKRLAKHFQDRPLLLYVFELLQQYHSSGLTCSFMSSYERTLQSRQQEYSWHLMQFLRTKVYVEDQTSYRPPIPGSFDYHIAYSSSSHEQGRRFVHRLFSAACEQGLLKAVTLLTGIPGLVAPEDIKRVFFECLPEGRLEMAKALLPTLGPLSSDRDYWYGNSEIDLLIEEIHSAARCNSAGKIGLLFDLYQASRPATERDCTLLHDAISYRAKEAVLLLVQVGADLSGRDGFGQTPLIVATRQGLKDMVQLLLTQGADPTASDYTGQSAYSIAENLQNEACKELLSQSLEKFDTEPLFDSFIYRAMRYPES